MIRSIRTFLLISLLLSIAIASSLSAIGNYYLNNMILRNHIDQNLLKNFALIKIMTQVTHNHSELQQNIQNWSSHNDLLNEQNLFFQVYSNQRELLYSSQKKIGDQLRFMSLGFNDVMIQQKEWRLYTGEDNFTKNIIVVGESKILHNKLIDDIARNDIYILLLTYPIFGALIWLIITIALSSSIRVTKEISNRAANHLEPLEIKNIPNEIKPMINELNRLFLRLKIAFERDKRFAGDAAHELRTPLAAIKAQAQVALKEADLEAQQSALKKIIQSVDRSSHTVTQLLTLSRINHEDELNDIRVVNLHQLAREIIAFLVPSALEKHIMITLENPPPKVNIRGNEISLGILIRNIVDNAIRYTPSHGNISIAILNTKNHVIFQVIDSGPGVPPELRERIFNRFYRITEITSSGSGLGLAIVKQIAALHQATIQLETPIEHSGLIFNVYFPTIN